MKRWYLCLVATLAAAALLTAPARAQTFPAFLDGLQETPPNMSPATGFGTVTLLDATTGAISVDLAFSGLLAPQTAAHIHMAPAGVPGPVIVPLPLGTFTAFAATLTPPQVHALQTEGLYFNVHTTMFPGGEIRGQILPEPSTLVLLGVGAGGLVAFRRRFRA